MAEELKISAGTKPQKYALLYKQVQALVNGEQDVIANMANVSAMIYATFGFLWVGFYRVSGEQLVLGPFQGPIACSRIMYGKGVCGTAWKERSTQCVPDVNKFPGHIACSSESLSEVVVPLFDAEKNVVAVLDIDSREYSTFDECDVYWLQKIAELI
ncbi:MAG: GAF domain-containing protein [Bacteroidaceae bacterium]|nr:GAF domain-containing protein [Bacteroidaceae bacterium]MBQ3623635.1 GAF domain-containing protein [Bacteroidaceae bacterium]